MDDETKLITSRLSRMITRDGITLEVLIYRSDGDIEWVLEVIDEEGASTVWEDTFATEADALNEVFQIIAADGMGSFVLAPARPSSS
jgi:hypothetical protein